MESLFDEAFRESTKTYETLGEKIVSRAEAEFNGYSDEEKSRRVEIQEIKEQTKKLLAELRSYPNIKNTKRTEANLQRSKKRKEIKKKIELLKLRLQEIEREYDHNKPEPEKKS